MSDPLTDQEIRLHAINLAASTYRELFRIQTRDRKYGEPDGEMDTADQVLADARRYAAWIARGDESAAPDKEN